MIVGCLGDIVFSVSSEVVKTLDKFKWSGGANYSVHKRQGYHALTEFTGMDADKISFEIFLSSYLGVDVQSEITKIWTYERNGTAIPLVIGDKGYGKYRWVIQKHSTKAETFDGRGNITEATVSIDLLEYIRW